MNSVLRAFGSALAIAYLGMSADVASQVLGLQPLSSSDPRVWAGAFGVSLLVTAMILTVIVVALSRYQRDITTETHNGTPKADS